MVWLLLNPKRQFLFQGDSLKVNFIYSVCVMYVVIYSYNKSFPYSGPFLVLAIRLTTYLIVFNDNDHLSEILTIVLLNEH